MAPRRARPNAPTVVKLCVPACHGPRGAKIQIARWGNVLTSRERDRVPALGDDPFLSDAEMRVKFRHPRSQDRCAPPRAAQSRPSRSPPGGNPVARCIVP